MNFRNIRIYGHEYEPEFFRAYGLRGWWIRVLNRIRLSLELRCQFHAMMVLGRIQGVDTETLAKQVNKDQQKIVRYIRESSDMESLATANPVQRLKIDPTEETIKTLARLTARGRSRRYRNSRRSYPIYESEAYPNGTGQSEGSDSPENREHQHTGEVSGEAAHKAG